MKTVDERRLDAIKQNVKTVQMHRRSLHWRVGYGKSGSKKKLIGRIELAQKTVVNTIRNISNPDIRWNAWSLAKDHFDLPDWNKFSTD